MIGEPTTTEVAEGVYAYVQPDGSWWINNTGFLAGDDGVVSIDTCATERRTRRYAAAIAGVTDVPVRTIVVTHHHGDHTNGNCLFPGATILAHERCREVVAASPIGFGDALWGGIDWGDLVVVAPQVTFTGRVDVHVGDLVVELHALDGPAHTVGDVIAWVPERSVLFAGDLVFNGGTPFVPMGSIPGSLAALERIRALAPDTIVPGHGPVCGVEVLDGIAEYLRWVQHLAAYGRARGRTPLEVATSADLGPFAALLDPERLAGNLHRAYAELDGAEPGAPIDLAAAFGDMVALNGGGPLPCCV